MKIIDKLNPTNRREVIKTAAAYAETFATEPWNEAKRCPRCDQFFGTGTITCPQDESALVDAYPIRPTTRYIEQEAGKPGAISFVVKDNQDTVGFGWGYQETGGDFARSKYKDLQNQRLVAETIGSDDIFLYVSEVGLVETARKQGFGPKLVEAITQGAPDLLLRTNRKSPMVKIAKKLGMTLVIGGEKTPSDPENPERVIFVKRSK